MYIKKLLNQKADELMKSTPQNVKKQADAFIKEVSKAVNSYVKEADDKVRAAEDKIQTPETDGQGEEYILKDASLRPMGMFPSIHRKKSPEIPLTCMHYQLDLGMPRYCSSICAGFQILDNGNVKLCDGDERNIVKE